MFNFIIILLININKLLEFNVSSSISKTLVQDFSNLNLTSANPGQVQPVFAQPQAVLSRLPGVCVAKVLGYCSKEETAGFGRINKAFAALFRPDHADNIAAKALIEQITGCSTLSSLKDLRMQVARLKALNAPHPAKKEWTIAEVLKMYRLRKIDFSQEEISNEDFQELLNALRGVHPSSSLHVSYLDLGKYRAVSKGQLAELLGYAPRLEHINIHCEPDDANEYLFEYFAKKDKANCLVYFNNNSDGFVENLRGFIINQTRLEYFSLPPMAYQSAFIRLLANSCPHLKNLKINTNLNIDDASQLRSAICYFAENQPELHCLDFGDLGHTFPRLTAQLIREVGEVCKNIKVLRFDSCTDKYNAINDAVIQAAFESCPQLESLFLRNAPKVTDMSFSQFSRAWPRLKELHLSGCHGASGKAVYSIIRDCSQLRTIALEDWALSKKVVQDYLQVRFLNQKLVERNISGTDFFKECKKLSPHLLEQCLEYSIWIHDGMPDHPRYGEKILQEDPEKLRTYTRPFISRQGGHFLRQLEERSRRELEDQLNADKFLSAAKADKVDLLISMRQSSARYQRESIELFSALLKDLEITQSQLNAFYKIFYPALTPSLQKRLFNQLLTEPGKLAQQMVEQNVRCLLHLGVVDSMIRSLIPMDHMCVLPAAVTSYIFTFADFKTFGALASVSKAFYAAVIRTKQQRKSLESLEQFRLEVSGILETLPGVKTKLSAGQIKPNTSLSVLLQFIQTLSEPERAALITRIEELYPRICTADIYMNSEMVQILQLLGKRAAQITTLNVLGRISGVPDFEQLRTLCPNLEKLDLRESHVTDEKLAEVGIGCPNLRSIDLARCNDITDEGILALVKGCKKLETIDLEGTAIKDKGVMAIADNCPKLISLNLNKCYPENNAIILYVAKCCPSLHYLQAPNNASHESCLDLLIDYPQVTEGYLGLVERYRRALDYIPVSPFGKLYSAILQRKPRYEIQQLLNMQDACFEKDHFLALIQPNKKELEFSLYDIPYEHLIHSMLQHLGELSIPILQPFYPSANIPKETKNRIEELFGSLAKINKLKAGWEKIIKDAKYHNAVCLADAFNLALNSLLVYHE